MKLKAEFPVGSRIGRLTVLGPSKRRYHVRCQCSCGAKIVAYESNLRRGKTRSCGSHRQGKGSIRVSVKRGDSSHCLYQLWRGIINRCYNKQQPHYSRYGGRGIAVCTRWLTFRKFAKDVGPRPQNHSLDRIDNNKGYSPANCRWATYKEQSTHKRVAANARLVHWNGKCRTLSSWSRQIGIPVGTLTKRFGAGWSIRRAMTTPLGNSGPK